MQSPYGKVEIVTIGLKQGEWRECQLAVDGRLAIPFSVHEEDWRSYTSDEKRLEMLARQSISLLDTYGDAREQPRIET
jgi:hypothetical protein